MMPGETHPAAPGPADLARCQGCASLQQNLNEYVEALIALKQKIINTDNLLTEYQKKCDELQFARRENSTLHHQVEQMLQKISPLQKCQEELGSLKAELEEKKSSLKLYQDTHREYARVKEECLRTDAQKKKLEAKVKKLEEAAVKQTQDFKQLRNEKTILEKEFKKTQERLDEFSKQKNEKELRHIGTQISSDSHGSIDKRKVKVLLKELWLCVNTAHRLSGEGGRRIPEKPAKGSSAARASEQDELLPGQGSPARPADMHSFFSKLSMEMEGDFSSSESAEEELPSGASPSTEHAFCEERHPEVSGQRPDDGNRTNVYDHEHFFDDDLQAAIDFFKLPPPLLSPVPSPPPMASGSSLAPESFFGEFTDSSDSDSVPPRDSMESALEDYTAESRGYFDLLEKIKRSDTYVKKPGSLEATQAVNNLTALGFVTGRTAPGAPLGAPLGAPSATSSLAQGRHWTAASEFVRDRGDSVEEAERMVETREVDKSVQVGKGLLKHNRRLWLEMASRGPARKKEAGPGESEVCFSPLGKRTFSELIESEGKTLSSKALCPSQSEFSKRTLTDGFASTSHCVTGSGRFQRRGRDVQESTPPRSGVCAAAAGRDHSASLPSSSSATSVPVSVCSNHQTSWLGCVSVGTPTEGTCTEQKSPTRTLNTFLLQSEPTACFPKENYPENSLSTLSPKSKLGTSTFSDWKSRGLESFSTLKSTAKGHSLPQSVFQKPTGGGQCKGRGPGTTLILPKSDWTSLARSQASFTRRSPGSADSTSWHRSDVLRRGSGGSPRASSEYQQRTRLQLEKATPASQNSRLTAMRGPPGESTIPPEFNAAAALLPNQVSVITKQARPRRVLGSSLEPWQPHGNTLRPAVNGGKETGLMPSVSACVGDGDPIAQVPEQVADKEIPSPEVSVSWRKPICDSPSGSLLAKNLSCSTDHKLPFSSEDNIFQCVMNEHLQQKPRKSPQTTQSGASRLEAGELLPSGMTSGVFPAKQMPHGPHHQADTDAPVAARESHSAPQNASAPPVVPSRGPLRARAPTGPVCPSSLSHAEEETQETSQSSLSGASYCYTGIRERGEEDTEVEDEAVSCSEGEHEAEAVMGHRQQEAAEDSHRPLGDPKAGVGEAGHPTDVGDLTSALQECNLSTLLYIDKLSTSEVVMVLESCQLRDYSSRSSASECSSKGSLNEEMNKELRQSEISRKKCEKRFCEEKLLRASEEWPESEGDDGCDRTSCQHAQCPLEVPSDVLTKTGEELDTNPVDCGGKDTEHALLVSTPHSHAADDLTEDALPEERSSPMPHTAQLSDPSAVDDGGSPPLSSRSDPEHIQSSYEDEPDSGECLSIGEEGPAEPEELLTLSSDSSTPPRLEQSSDCAAETAFRYQISAVTSEVISVLINKDQDLVIEKGDNWTIISGVAISPGMEQVVLCDTLGDAAPSQDQGGLDDSSMEKSPEASPSGPLPQEPPCGGGLSGAQEDISSNGQSANFDKSRLRNRPVKPSIWIRSQIYDQTLETEKVASDHTYYNWKLEPLGKNKPRSKITNKDQASKLAKTPVLNRGDVHHLNEVPQPVSGERTNIKMPSQAQPIMAGTDMSTPTNCSPDTLSKIRQEVGPPLPPLLPPLIATPPRSLQTLSPLVPNSGPSSRSSPAGHVSPLCEVPGPPVLSPWPEELEQASPLDPSLSPCTAAASGRIVSSPLQFCAATPKHALPVPGRLPSCTPGHAAVSGPQQENSVKILDTMYPELSARARTLSLLKGNMQLSRGSTVDGKVLPGRVSALLGLKAITSTSTAFVLTGGSSGADSSQGKSQDSGVQQDAGGKRTLAVSMLRSAKRLRLDNESPEQDTREVTGEGVPEDPQEGSPLAEVVRAEEERADVPVCSAASLLRVNPREMAESYNIAITRALRKIAESSFDLLPVIRSHVYVGNISKKPVMRDQEKEVVYEFSTTNKHLGEYLLRSILSELKIQKTSLDHSYIHALCRVYVGICRQLGDLERARLFCYSLLKEDFPESEKLTLFIANMWREVFLSQSAISEAMQLVARQRARGEVLNCLRAFLSWEKNAPIDVGIVVSKLLLTIQLCPKTEFQSSEEFGEDLSANIWEYIFAIDLLCCHQRWIWTHDNIISKELWPVMDKWIKYRKGHSNIAYTPDVIVASVLRLIGRLGQLGLKEGFPTAVKNISSVIGMFIQHAQDEDIPWGVQLAAVYALCDLSPSNPAEISKILEAWRTQASNAIPSAIVSCLEEVGSLSADGSAGCPSKGDCTS